MDERFSLSGEMRREFETQDTIRHQSAKPPKEAYLYIPKDDDIILFDEKHPSRTLRRIFEGGVEYNNYEKIKLKEFRKELEKHNNSIKKTKLILPENWKDCHILRFLQASQYNIIKTTDIILNHIEWRKVNLPPKITDKSKEILNSGFIYIHGRDSRFRPIMNICANKYEKYKKYYTFADWERAVIYFMEYSIQNLLIPGQVENWDIICDLKDVSITSIPEDLKKILGILQNNYRCRLYVMYIINIGGWISFGWTIIKKFLDASTEKKIQLLKSSNIYEMFKYINPRQIEKKFGGTAEDIKNYFFPPIFPDNNFILANEKSSNLLISEEKYLNLLQERKEMTPCPYLFDLEVKLKNNTHSSVMSSGMVSRINSNVQIVEKYNSTKNNENDVSQKIEIKDLSIITDKEHILFTPEDKSVKNVVEININNHTSFMPKGNDNNSDESFDLRNDLEVERFHQKSGRRITKTALNPNSRVLTMSSLNKAVENIPIILNSGPVNKKKSGLAVKSIGLNNEISNFNFSNDETVKFSSGINSTVHMPKSQVKNNDYNTSNPQSSSTVHQQAKNHENLGESFEILTYKDSNKVCCDPGKLSCIIM